MAQIKTNLAYGVTGTIPTANIADDAITSAKLADDSVVAAAIADNAVVTAAINADAITAAKVADDAINSEHLVDGGVDDAHLATGIASSKLTGALPAISGASLTGITTGKVLQVVQNTTNTATTTSSSTSEFTLTDINVVITPSASSSKILVMMEAGGHVETASNGEIRLSMYRDISGGTTGTQIVKQDRYAYKDGTGYGNSPFPITMHYLDSPSTTSATTYYFKMKSEGSGGFSINYSGQTHASRIIAMEIDNS